MAAHQIMVKASTIGGGVESITMAKRDFEPNPSDGVRPGIYMVMGDTAEVVAAI
jgi:hypothetical protein